MYIHQYLLDILLKIQADHKALVIYGPRQVGKTTLLNKLLEQKKNYLFVDGDDVNVQYYLSSRSIELLKSFVGSHQLLVIDEAQRVPNIGLNLKLLIDHFPDLQIIATGSSAFDLAQNVGEPLTGRKLTFKMFPLSQMEIGNLETMAQTRANLENRLIYGSYPEVVLKAENKLKKDYLRELVTSYLCKDIIELEGIRKSKKITTLLQLVAFQIGKEVSVTELGQQVGLSKNTVERYLDLFEQAFILINISGYARNLRKAISKKSRYYFYDTGVRNALINQFNPIGLRNDVGELWENYIVMERIKKQSYQNIYANNYFLKTYDQQEVDWVEERDGELYGYEIKWKPKKVKPPVVWQKSYENAHFQVIHRDNYLDFIA
ncbi:MAG: ATP-binding protein [Clostridiales bacterium]|nr:ATP-binding protein [Clostridiales bacterium]